jgi:hypothetical protein
MKGINNVKGKDKLKPKWSQDNINPMGKHSLSRQTCCCVFLSASLSALPIGTPVAVMGSLVA